MSTSDSVHAGPRPNTRSTVGTSNSEIGRESSETTSKRSTQIHHSHPHSANSQRRDLKRRQNSRGLIREIDDDSDNSGAGTPLLSTTPKMPRPASRHTQDTRSYTHHTLTNTQTYQTYHSGKLSRRSSQTYSGKISRRSSTRLSLSRRSSRSEKSPHGRRFVLRPEDLWDLEMEQAAGKKRSKEEWNHNLNHTLETLFGDGATTEKQSLASVVLEEHEKLANRANALSRRGIRLSLVERYILSGEKKTEQAQNGGVGGIDEDLETESSLFEGDLSSRSDLESEEDEEEEEEEDILEEVKEEQKRPPPVLGIFSMPRMSKCFSPNLPVEEHVMKLRGRAVDITVSNDVTIQRKLKLIQEGESRYQKVVSKITFAEFEYEHSISPRGDFFPMLIAGYTSKELRLQIPLTIIGRWVYYTSKKGVVQRQRLKKQIPNYFGHLTPKTEKLQPIVVVKKDDNVSVNRNESNALHRASLVDTLEKGQIDHENTLFQQYVRPGGFKAQLVRYQWFPNQKPCKAWVIANTKKYSERSCSVTERYCTTVANSDLSMVVSVYATSYPELADICFDIVKHVQANHPNITFETFVGDFLKDKHGKWIFIQAKAFRVVDKVFVSGKSAGEIRKATHAYGCLSPSTSPSPVLPPSPTRMPHSPSPMSPMSPMLRSTSGMSPMPNATPFEFGGNAGAGAGAGAADEIQGMKRKPLPSTTSRNRNDVCPGDYCYRVFSPVDLMDLSSMPKREKRVVLDKEQHDHENRVYSFKPKPKHSLPFKEILLDRANQDNSRHQALSHHLKTAGYCPQTYYEVRVCDNCYNTYQEIAQKRDNGRGMRSAVDVDRPSPIPGGYHFEQKQLRNSRKHLHDTSDVSIAAGDKFGDERHVLELLKVDHYKPASPTAANFPSIFDDDDVTSQLPADLPQSVQEASAMLDAMHRDKATTEYFSRYRHGKTALVELQKILSGHGLEHPSM